MKELIETKWDEILEKLQYSENISQAVINAFIKPLWIYDLKIDNKNPNNNEITFVLASHFDSRGIEFIRNKFYDLSLQVILQEVTGIHFNTNFVLQSDIDADGNLSIDTIEPDKPIIYNNLNPKYTFESFVVGKDNKFAHAVCIAVAENPGALIYNPLFIYGGVGLGKTHLMHSIAHYLLEHSSSAKVLYATSEKFTNEVIDSIRHNKTEEFRKKYRSIDVLLIDDIQFLAGKTSTQEEFFHTFNELHNAKKQIIISSDRSPNELEILESRLSSRFQGGISVDIKLPDFETRVAILRKRVEIDNIEIEDMAIQYIATNINSNIRELEGALHRVVAYSRLENSPIDLPMAEDVLKDLITSKYQPEITPEFIIDIVAEHYNITSSDICSKKKGQLIAYPRQIAMYLCREFTDKTLKEIGSIMGKRDHSTILHGAERIQSELEINETIKKEIDVLIKKIDPITINNIKNNDSK